ncbi:hypothetical protein Hsw_4009 [Hymenobacter swuensis DY53]|uniref:Uncharacterized protein n=1 Tax=Hymenobacter swuensis DY53 TaxID=1227739 RepID=W8F2I4_9BACT|nr:hypothetical protein Hsw_4009 [Hymenobacter swuensis DY53]
MLPVPAAESHQAGCRVLTPEYLPGAAGPGDNRPDRQPTAGPEQPF